MSLSTEKIGASTQTRTGTPLLARDFKSLVSTYSTMEANWPALEDSNL